MKILFWLSSFLITFLCFYTSALAQEPVDIAQLKSYEESSPKEQHFLKNQTTQEAAKTSTRTALRAKPDLIVKEIKLDTGQLTSPSPYYFLAALDKLHKAYQGKSFSIKQFEQSLKKANNTIAQEHEKGTDGFVTDELIFEGIDEDGTVRLAVVGKVIESIQDCWTWVNWCKAVNPNVIQEAGIKPGDRYPNFYRANGIVSRLIGSGGYQLVSMSSFPGQSSGKIDLAFSLIEFSPSQLALIEARRLHGKNTADNFRKAIIKYQEVLLLAKNSKKANLKDWITVPVERWRFLDKNMLALQEDKIEFHEGDVLLEIAESYKLLGEFYQSLHYLQKALPVYKIKSREDAEKYQNIVEVCQRVYKRDCSQEPQVLTLLLRKEESSVLESIADIYKDLGDQLTARQQYQQALSILLEKRNQQHRQQTRGTP